MSADHVVIAGDATPLAVRDYGGTGTPLVLLHGLGEHQLSMERLATILTGEFRVASLDLRWSGQSGSSPSFGWDLLVDDVDDVCAALVIDQPVIVGHSLGGIVATRYGLMHPGCRGVVNVDGWGFGDPVLYDGMDPIEAERVIRTLRQSVDPLAKFQRTGDSQWAVSARGLMRELVESRGVDEQRLDAWVDRMFLELHDGYWRIQPDPVIYDSMRTDARVFELLDEIECPVLIVPSDVATAANDVVAARRRGVAARLLLLVTSRPNITVHGIAGSDHNNLVTTCADEVAAAIRSFVAKPPTEVVRRRRP